MDEVVDRLVEGGPYEEVVVDLLASVAKVWPHLDGGSIALGGPLWFARRVGEEIGEPTTPLVGGLEVVRVRRATIVGVPTLQSGPFGSFIAQDLVGGSCYRLPARCHCGLHPSCWRSLTLAVQHGLNPAAALSLAELGA